MGFKTGVPPINIAGTQVSPGDSVTQDNITGLGSTGLVKRTGSNTLAIATSGSDYLTSLATNADAPDSTINIAVTSGSPATIASKALTISSGDSIEVEVEGTILNNSGATKAYTWFASLGSLNVTLSDTTPTPSSSSNRSTRYIKAIFGVTNTSSAWLSAAALGYAPAALGSGGTVTAGLSFGGSQRSSSNLTGSQNVSLQMYSNTATPTQSFELTSYIIRRIPTNP